MVLGLIAAACGGDDGDSASDNGGSDEVDQGDQNSANEDTGTPAPGGSVTYALEAESAGGFCLAEAQLAIGGMQVARSIYDTLTLPGKDGDIHPYLAETIDPNDDYTEWTITLREGIKFHDGTDLTAEVVKNNLDAYRGAYEARNPLLLTFIFEDIESVEAPDARTVVVNTKRPWVAFPWTLWTSNRIGIMSQSQLDSENCGEDLVGTGPFMLENPGDRVVNEQTRLVKNPNYWQTDENGVQLPYLDEIIYKPIEDGTQRVSALETGQVDAIHTSGTQDIEGRLKDLVDEGKLNMTANDTYGEVNYLMLNASKPPFDNKNARLAVAYGLDRELLDEVRGAGTATIADGPFQEDVLGYVEDTGFPQFDPTQAEQYAADYEAETGQPLEFAFSTTATEASQLTAQEIAGQLNEVGIEMSTRASADQTTLINEAISGDFEMAGFRNHPGADPDTQYNWWYEGSPVNFGRIADAKINEYLDEGRTNPDPDARKEAYENLNRRFGEEVYNIWTTFTQWAIATGPEVQGVFGPPLPDGGEAFEGLATGHPSLGLYVNTSDDG